ncbi:MAG: protein-L-isoaspartate O-methyltransferase [Patescibacteria group bacterium]
MNSSNELAKYLEENGFLKTPEIIEAFAHVLRADFVKSEDREYAYENVPLQIGYEQTISEPSVVAFMLELLQPKKGQKVLDIGSGSGFTATLLARIVGPEGMVFGVEKIPALVELGATNIEKYGFHNWAIKLAGKEVGDPDNAPFDRILVSASAESLPEMLVGQLMDEGRMVIPVRNSILLIEKNAKGQIDQTEFPGFVFVPLT